MESSRTPYKVIIFMLVIYMIASVQFLAKEICSLAKISRMTYYDKLNFLDKQYYRKLYYKYYVWLDGLLPKDFSFSIFYNKRSHTEGYLKYTHKLNYYMYPKHVLIKGIEQDTNIPPRQWPTKYTEAVLLLNTKEIDLRANGGVKYMTLNGQKYFLVSALDDKGLLMEGSFIKNTVLKKKGWENVIRSFKGLNGANMEKAIK